MAELPLETEETGSDLPEGFVPPEFDDDGDAESAATSAPQSASTPYMAVLLRDRYLVDSTQPLPEFDTPSAKAFVVEDRQDSKRQLYGLVCMPGMPVRLNSIRFLMSGNVANILPLFDWDSVMWPPLEQKTLVVVFVRPQGGRVIDRLARKEAKITEYEMPRRVIEPIVDSLQILARNDEPHRAIRPNNFLFLDDRMEQIALGPHVTAPAGYDQPAMLEPLDRAMADPAGRGIGDSGDDIYALGVTIVLLLLGYNPVAKMKDDELLKARIERGSYAAICDNARIPMQLIEPLRGMLADDPAERWDFNEITNWLTGQKINPVKKKPMVKSEFSFKFRDQEHVSARSLAWHFARYPQDAAKALVTDQFDTWIGHSLGDLEKMAAIKSAVQVAQFHVGSYQGSDDYLIARVTAILDPEGPIRYKGLAFMADGYGPVLATQWIHKDDPQAAAEILSYDISTLWYSAQSWMTKEHFSTQKVFTQLKGLLKINDPGYGLKRVLYESNPGVSCQSPHVAKDGVILIDDLLPALDNAANNVDTSSQPVDDHVAAFIAARFKEDIYPHLKALGSDKADTSIIGALSLLAFLQWKLRAPAILGLSSWLGGLLGPAINAYHNRRNRRELEQDIPRLVRKGSLPELFNLIDNPEKRKEDQDGFAASRKEWLEAEIEIRDIEGAGDERLTKAERSGQQAAAMISISIALTVITILVMAEMI